MRKNGKLRCVHNCPYFTSTVKDDNSKGRGIGYCKRFNLIVIDTLCGCKTREKKIVLWNFSGQGEIPNA